MARIGVIAGSNALMWGVPLNRKVLQFACEDSLRVLRLHDVASEFGNLASNPGGGWRKNHGPPLDYAEKRKILEIVWLNCRPVDDAVHRWDDGIRSIIDQLRQ